MNAVVSCAIGGHYPELMEHGRSHWRRWKENDEHIFRTVAEPGWPSGMYGFKIHSLEPVREVFDLTLWTDSTFRPVASLHWLWDKIHRDEWFAMKQGDSALGTWAMDTMLEAFGITRDQAMHIPMFMSGLVGFKRGSELSQRIWTQWRETYLMGLWDGPHKNEPGEEVRIWGNKLAGHCSYDRRCEGHRHDEAALSYILWKAGLTPTICSHEVPCMERNFLAV